MEGPSAATAVVQFMPLVIFSLIVGAFALPMVKRKGLGPVYAFLCFVPLLNYFLLMWIASQRDKDPGDHVAGHGTGQ